MSLAERESALIARLNAEIVTFNADVDDAVETGDMAAAESLTWKVPPGSATHELIYADTWPEAFNKAFEVRQASESPLEIKRLCKLVKEPTEITRQLGFGAAKASKINSEEPVLVKLIHLAHLVARAGQQEPVGAVPNGHDG